MGCRVEVGASVKRDGGKGRGRDGGRARRSGIEAETMMKTEKDRR